jgi:hypothetical protein
MKVEIPEAAVERCAYGTSRLATVLAG